MMSEDALSHKEINKQSLRGKLGVYYNYLIYNIHYKEQSPMMKPQSANHRTPKPCQPEKCPDCYSILEHYDNVKYCQNCKKCPTLMDASLREPNYNFKLHYSDNKIPSSVLKIQGHVKDIMCKLEMRVTDCSIDKIVSEVRNMHWKRGSKCKGYREETALIIYRLFEDQIRMTIHQFCMKTGIVKKKFNKMLIYFQNMDKNTTTQHKVQNKLPKLEDDIYQSDSNEVKQQNQHQVPDQQQPNQNEYNFHTYIQAQNLRFQSPLHLNHEQVDQQNNQSVQFNEVQERQVLTRTIEILYDKIFTGNIFKKYKSDLIKSVIQKSLQLYQEFLASGDGNIPKKYFRAPAIIYNVIKSHGCKISKKKYTQIVEKHLEVRITDRMISKFANSCRKSGAKNDQDDQGSSPSSLENRESPTKSQPLVV